jgi:hypothetical protein
MNDIERLLETYWAWLRERMSVREVGNWTEITTPYLDRHNDYIQLYAKREDDRIRITDGGETLADLAQSGFGMRSEKRQDILRYILNGFGVKIGEDQSIFVDADDHNFALKKHNLVQALLSVNDMFFLAAPTVEALFFEDVAKWLDSIGSRYTERVKFSGRSGFDYVFDFVLPKSPREPERIVRAINNPTKATAQNFILAWLDTKETRPINSVPLAILNDNLKSPPEEVEDALSVYGIRPLSWKRREEYHDLLAA